MRCGACSCSSTYSIGRLYACYMLCRITIAVLWLPFFPSFDLKSCAVARVLKKLTTKAKTQMTMAVPAFPTATRLMKRVTAKYVKPMKAVKELFY